MIHFVWRLSKFSQFYKNPSRFSVCHNICVTPIASTLRVQNKHFCSDVEQNQKEQNVTPVHNVNEIMQGIDIHVHPVVLANDLIRLLSGTENEILASKRRISDIVEHLVLVDSQYTATILYHFLKELGPVEVSKLIRGAMDIPMTSIVLAHMAHNNDWREYALMDMMVELMKDWHTDDMKLVILKLPRISISQKPDNEISSTVNDVQPLEENQVVQEEIDYYHPSAFWGYRKRIKEDNKLERSRTRLTSDIIGNNRILLSIPYKAHSAEWFPDEIGALIGRLLADEWELDYITYLLVDLATNHFADNPQQHKWEDYLGYVGIILSSACSVVRHWENEDIMWVYKDFCIDVGRWALHMWSNFREMEYREWLADIVVLVATRRNDYAHDTKLINSILEETCEQWAIDKSDYIAYMISARMKSRTFPFLQFDHLLSKFGLRQNISEPVQTRSFLWSPPPHYYLPELWVAEQQRMDLLEPTKQNNQLLNSNTNEI